MDVLQFIELFLDHEDDGIVDDEDTFPSIAVALTTRRREHVPKVIGFDEDVVPNYSMLSLVTIVTWSWRTL